MSFFYILNAMFTYSFYINFILILRRYINILAFCFFLSFRYDLIFFVLEGESRGKRLSGKTD